MDDKYADCRNGHHSPVDIDTDYARRSVYLQAGCSVCGATLDVEVRIRDWCATYDKGSAKFCGECEEAMPYCECDE